MQVCFSLEPNVTRWGEGTEGEGVEYTVGYTTSAKSDFIINAVNKKFWSQEPLSVGTGRSILKISKHLCKEATVLCGLLAKETYIAHLATD